jgi:hypothetical protein
VSFGANPLAIGADDSVYELTAAVIVDRSPVTLVAVRSGTGFPINANSGTRMGQEGLYGA